MTDVAGVSLWLFGFPSPVIEFFILGVLLFLSTSLYLANNMEPFEGIEGEDRREQRTDRGTLTED